MTVFISWKELKNSTLGRIKAPANILIGPETESPPHMRSAENTANSKKIAEHIQNMKETQTNIILYHPLIETDELQLSFDALLLDERYAQGYISFPLKYLEEGGYLNERLPAKRIYEWLLRIAENHVAVIGKPLPPFMNGSETECYLDSDAEADYQADCFIVSKYAERLRALGYFDTIVNDLILQAQTGTNETEKIQYLESMLSRSWEYFRIADGVAPILIYHGVTYCYNILNVLAEQLEKALARRGERIEIYDEQQEGAEGLIRCAGRRFKAVVGIQTYLMSIYLKQSGRYLHDEIRGPKFNMVLDHPIWLRDLLKQVPGNYYILTHDENYRQFIQEYYQEVTGTFLFPPAGIQAEKELFHGMERKYDLVFIGTYGNYREKCSVIRQCVPEVRKIALRFLHYLKRNPDVTAEKAFCLTLQDYQIYPEKEQFLDMFFELRSVVQLIMYYYREKTVKTLLDAGITIDIWGSSWKESPLAGHPYLQIHEDISSEESLAVLRQSKISINVMAWHKGGFTERIANSMLAGAMVLTDKTTYRENGLQNGKQLQMFSLAELKDLPALVKKILGDDGKRLEIAQNGYEYAMEYHTWDKRAEQLLTYIEVAQEGV